jgi:uncharacterized RmlC-like cupin family protein
MNHIKNCTWFLVIISVLFLLSCNQPATTSEKKDTDTTTAVTSRDTSSMPAYDPAMDALKVAAKFSKLLHDTLNIKMYVVTLKPGDSAALHAHPDHTVYVLQGGKALISFNGAPSAVMNLVEGTGFVAPALTDAGKNIGITTIKLVVTDIYRPRGR